MYIYPCRQALCKIGNNVRVRLRAIEVAHVKHNKINQIPASFDRLTGNFTLTMSTYAVVD